MRTYLRGKYNTRRIIELLLCSPAQFGECFQVLAIQLISKQPCSQVASKHAHNFRSCTDLASSAVSIAITCYRYIAKYKALAVRLARTGLVYDWLEVCREWGRY